MLQWEALTSLDYLQVTWNHENVKKPLKIRIYLLDLEFKEGWEFLYSLIGDAKGGITFDDYYKFQFIYINKLLIQ